MSTCSSQQKQLQHPRLRRWLPRPASSAAAISEGSITGHWRYTMAFVSSPFFFKAATRRPRPKTRRACCPRPRPLPSRPLEKLGRPLPSAFSFALNSLICRTSTMGRGLSCHEHHAIANLPVSSQRDTNTHTKPKCFLTTVHSAMNLLFSMIWSPSMAGHGSRIPCASDTETIVHATCNFTNLRLQSQGTGAHTRAVRCDLLQGRLGDLLDHPSSAALTDTLRGPCHERGLSPRFSALPWAEEDTRTDELDAPVPPRPVDAACALPLGLGLQNLGGNPAGLRFSEICDKHKFLIGPKSPRACFLCFRPGGPQRCG